MKTRRELVTQALQNLGAAYPGQAADAGDYADVDKYVDGLIDRLSQLGIVTIPYADEIEDKYFQPLAVFLADAAKAEFGGTYDIATAEIQLRKMSRTGPTYEIVEGEFM